MRKVALIPARGGSKRIPNKNIKDFCGKPIIAYPIATALESKLFDEVIVSTDSHIIAQIALDYGAKVPFMRPTHLSDDFTPTADVANHAIDMLNLSQDDLLCVIYPTAPLLSAKSLNLGYLALQDSAYLFSFAAVAYDYTPYRSFCFKNGEIAMLFPAHYAKRSQDLEQVYHDAGQFYFGRVGAWQEALPIFAPHSYAIILKSYQVQDIDTLDDWQMAEIKYKLQENLASQKCVKS